MYLAPYESQLYIDHLEYRIYKWTSWLGNPFLFIVGSLGNSLLIWLLLPNIRVTPTYQYLIALGFVDQLVLTSGLLKRWFHQFLGFNLEILCAACCPLNKFISYFSSYFSAVLIIVVSVERALVVCFPLKAASLQSAKRIRLIIAGIMLLCFLVNAHWFFILDRVSDPNSNATVGFTRCDIRDSAQGLSGLISVLDAVLYSILPLLVIFSCNIVTICKLRQAGSNRRDQLNASHGGGGTSQIGGSGGGGGGGSGGSEPQSAAQENVRHVTILLLSISTFYLVASLPVALLKILTTLSNAVDVNALSLDTQSYSRYLLIESVTNLFMFSNHAANFFLYCASGSRIRNELRIRLRQLCTTQGQQSRQSGINSRNNGSQRVTGTATKPVEYAQLTQQSATGNDLATSGRPARVAGGQSSISSDV